MTFKGKLRNAALSLVAIGAFVSPAVIPSSAAAKHCPSYDVRGVIDGQQKCLGRGEYCAKDDNTEYHRYGFKCVSVNGTPRLEPRG
jgi:hypothetical protein